MDDYSFIKGSGDSPSKEIEAVMFLAGSADAGNVKNEGEGSRGYPVRGMACTITERKEKREAKGASVDTKKRGLAQATWKELDVAKKKS